VIEFVNKDRLRLAVEALRSGRFVQGTGALERDGRNCCLGVLCRVAMENGLDIQAAEKPDGDMAFGERGDTAYLPPEVYTWYGLDVHNMLLSTDGNPQESATYLNDTWRWTFEMIADAMERTWEL